MKINNNLRVRSFSPSARATRIDPPEYAEANVVGHVEIEAENASVEESLVSWFEAELDAQRDGACYRVTKWTLNDAKWDTVAKVWRVTFTPEDWESHDPEPEDRGGPDD